MSKVILPGATIGIFGGGQLGRMCASAAREMGYGVHIFCPEKDAIAVALADKHISADYEDIDALKSFAQGVDVVTFEFENIPFEAAKQLEDLVPVRPRSEVLHISQNRLREKTTLKEFGIPVTPFCKVAAVTDVTNFLSSCPNGAVLKSAEFGYDGKGQAVIESIANVEKAWEKVGNISERILEEKINLKGELSVIIAKNHSDQIEASGPFENIHINGILDSSCYPSSFSKAVCNDAIKIATKIAKDLKYEGVLCVEFFLDTKDNLFVNEIAPRPHNSGHLTIDSFLFSQFHQQVRTVCNLTLGLNKNLSPASMVNLLGDLWENGEPKWDNLNKFPTARLHLYGKKEPRIGRKMGHITVCSESASSAREIALAARDSLQ